MFAIRRIFDDLLPVNRIAIARVIEIHRRQFPGAREKDREDLATKLRNPFKQHLQSVLYVAERRPGDVLGFAVIMRDPELKFVFLDYIATDSKISSQGVGGALYVHLREEAKAFGAVAMFFECLPDDPAKVSDPSRLAQNKARLKFYESWGARPISNPAYETRLSPEDQDMPYLVVDSLDRDSPLKAAFVAKVARAILERKYDYLCPAWYVEKVVSALQRDPVRLRPFRYRRDEAATRRTPARRPSVALFVNDRHDIHHVARRQIGEQVVRLAVRSSRRSRRPTSRT